MSTALRMRPHGASCVSTSAWVAAFAKTVLAQVEGTVVGIQLNRLVLKTRHVSVMACYWVTRPTCRCVILQRTVRGDTAGRGAHARCLFVCFVTYGQKIIWWIWLAPLLRSWADWWPQKRSRMCPPARLCGKLAALRLKSERGALYLLPWLPVALHFKNCVCLHIPYQHQSYHPSI